MNERLRKAYIRRKIREARGYIRESRKRVGASQILPAAEAVVQLGFAIGCLTECEAQEHISEEA